MGRTGAYKKERGHSYQNKSIDQIKMSNSMDEDTSVLPTYFTFKIQSFSLLATTSMKKFKSNDFEGGGYKWRLVFYPKGSNTSTLCASSSLGNPPHVSMYLKIVGTDSLPRGWVIDVSFRFFVLDQIRDKYLIIGDTAGTTRRFHEMKKMWGYDQLLPLTTLNDSSSNGYLVDDACVFGAELLLCNSTGCGDCLTMVKSPSCVKYTWKIENFSKIEEESIYSDVFDTQEFKWKIQVCPKGDSGGNNEYFSMYLYLDDDLNNKKVYAGFNYRVRDQLHNCFHREQVYDEKWFTSSFDWGNSEFIRLDELNDESKGYLVNDACIVEAEVTVLGALQKKTFISLII